MRAVLARRGNPNPQSIADLQTSYSPSLAEGARGWVSLDSTAVIASGFDKIRVAIYDFLRYFVLLSPTNFWIAMLTPFARNDGVFLSLLTMTALKSKKTHPQTPSAMEGAYFGLPRKI
ncbi:hypothetical protein [Helicobacter sp. T3_23-1059]